MKQESVDLRIESFLQRKSRKFPDLDEIVRKD